MQSTAPHWTVMLEEVTADILTEVGALNGATCKRFRKEVEVDNDTSMLKVQKFNEGYIRMT